MKKSEILIGNGSNSFYPIEFNVLVSKNCFSNTFANFVKKINIWSLHKNFISSYNLLIRRTSI